MGRQTFDDSTRFATRSVTVTVTNDVLEVELDVRALLNQLARASRDAIANGLSAAAAGMDKRMQHGARWLAGDVSWSQSGNFANVSVPDAPGAAGLVGFLRGKVAVLRDPLDHPAVQAALGHAIGAMFQITRRR
jgi:hypothetical protein